MGSIRIEHIYDHAPRKPHDYRILVDRLWPRGISKERADLDEWCKDIAPSTQARQEFHHEPANFPHFTEVYQHELETSEPARRAVEHVLEVAKDHDVVLLYGAHDPKINHAVVLKDYLDELREKDDGTE